ncbi:MAG: acyltransferase [Corallococcus sp.]|nr:acyltransferase [Corallococcus sp.]
MINQKNRNIFLDIMKYFLAFLVVNLHCGERLKTYSRLAVPMFFMISGYFLYKKGMSRKEETDYALTYLVRAITYCLGAFLIQILGEMAFMRLLWNTDLSSYFYSLFNFSVVKDILLLNHPIFELGYHLWFLMALLDIGIVHYLLVRFDKTKWYVWLVPVLMGVSYFFGPFVSKMHGTETLTEAYRNGLTWGVPYAGIGYFMAKYKNDDEPWYVKYVFLALGIASFVLIKYEDEFQGAYLTTLVGAYCLMRFFTALRSPDCKYFYKFAGAQGYLYVYIIHILVFDTYLFQHVFTWSTKAAWITFATSFALYEVAYLIVTFIRAFPQIKRKVITKLRKVKA